MLRAEGKGRLARSGWRRLARRLHPVPLFHGVHVLIGCQLSYLEALSESAHRHESGGSSLAALWHLMVVYGMLAQRVHVG